MKTILSLDGGGIRGLVTAAILTRLDVQPDLICGTSTGGLLGLMLSRGSAPATILEAYREYAPMIFRRPWWRRGLAESKYPADGIERAAFEIFGDRHMFDCKVPTMAVAYSLAKSRPKVFKSWTDHDELLRDVARATSAAPTYFPPTEDGLIDGGVWANDPALCAVTEARLLWPGECLQMISIGTGTTRERVSAHEASGWGLAGWGPHIVDVLMSATGGGTEYLLRAQMGDRYRRIQPDLGGIPSAMDRIDPDHMEALVRLGMEWELPL